MTGPVAMTASALLFLAVCLGVLLDPPSAPIGLTMIACTVVIIAAAIINWVSYGQTYIEYRIDQRLPPPVA